MNDPRPARLTAADFDPDVLKLFDQYVHGAIDRRGFLDKASRVAAAGGTTAAALLAALSPDFAYGQKVAPNDARIRTERVEIPSTGGHGKIAALVARPANASAALPVVLVVHENRGLNPHIEDIARRLAVDNFIAVAPDALSPSGGYPGDEDKARGASTSSTPPRRARTSSPPRPGRARWPAATARSAPSASAGVAPSSTSSPRARPSWWPARPSTAPRRRWTR
jgi:hypothetical protein